MTLDEKKLVLELVRGKLGKQEFLEAFRSTENGEKLGFRLLREGIRKREADEVEYAIMIGFAFGFSKDHVYLLCQLLAADWHFQHEDIVTILGKIADPSAIKFLYGATQSIPQYLSFDDSRALAVKAIWALGRFPQVEATNALLRLAESGDLLIRNAAQYQMRCRTRNPSELQ